MSRSRFRSPVGSPYQINKSARDLRRTLHGRERARVKEHLSQSRFDEAAWPQFRRCVAWECDSGWSGWNTYRTLPQPWKYLRK